jgi:hypothetical protein
VALCGAECVHEPRYRYVNQRRSSSRVEHVWSDRSGDRHAGSCAGRRACGPGCRFRWADDGVRRCGLGSRRIGVPAGRSVLSDGWRGWLGSRRVWTVVRSVNKSSLRDDQDPAGFWVVFARPPAGGAGADLRLRRGDASGRVLRPQWIDPVVRGADPADPAVRARAFARVVPQTAVTSPELGTIVGELSADPLTAWRAELVRSGLDPFRSFPGERSPSELLTSLDESGQHAPGVLLDAWRDLDVALWRAALLRLWAFDSRLAERVRLVLGRVVSPRPGSWVPMWVSDDAAAELREHMLSPGLSSAERGELVARWLEDRPTAAAWVVDDAVQVQGPAPSEVVAGMTEDRLVSRVAVADLTGNGTIAWVERTPDGSGEAIGSDTGGAREIFSVSAQNTIDLSFPAPEPNRFGRREEVWSSLRLRFADGSAELAVQGRSVGLRPPGYPIVGFQPDLRLDSLIDSESVQIGVLRPPAIAASIERVSVEPASRTTLARHAWVLEVRLGSNVGENDPTHEQVSVWFGRRGRSVARAELDEAGRVDWQTGSESVEPLTRVVFDDAGRVSGLLIEIDNTLVGRDGMLRLGMQAIDPNGTRWSWPRASVPWEDEPSRLGIELDTWFAPEE